MNLKYMNKKSIDTYSPITKEFTETFEFLQLPSIIGIPAITLEITQSYKPSS